MIRMLFANCGRSSAFRARMLVGFGLLSALVTSAARTGSADEALPAVASSEVDFNRDVWPILVSRCVECHGPDTQESSLRVDRRENLLEGGDYGEPAVLPGKSEASHLIRIVAGLNPDLKMPPDGARLTAKQIGTLRAWIDQGAEMPAEPGGEVTLTTDHWSFQPIRRPPLPDEKALGPHAPWVRNPVDAFILARLHERQLEPSSEADRATLIRRLYLDLTGLLPPPQDVERFVNDPSPKAYERLVERLLTSPHYGERWGRHWLDVIRFAESDGFETNHERPNAYRFRDYVIRSFNEDKPFNTFMFEQIAGDTVGADVATGFLVGGAYDRVKSPDPGLTAMQRQDELADMVNTTSTAFLGLTLGCARCHNHKFDPLLQTDYYEFQAIFAGVQHGERTIQTPDTDERRKRLENLAAEIEQLEEQFARYEPAAFVGSTLLLDDSDPTVAQPLIEPKGEGINPGGAERGYRDDPGEPGRVPNVSGGRYTWWDATPNQPLLNYRPRTGGAFGVWISWGCGWETHVRDARYVLDADGDPQTTTDQTPLATVDQQRFADGSGTIPGQPLWSGFYFAGVHQFDERTTILLQSGTEAGAVTADAIVLQRSETRGGGDKSEGRVATGTTAERQAQAQPRLGAAVNARINEEVIAPVIARFLRFEVLATSGAEPCLDELEVWTDEASPRNIALAAAGTKVRSSGDYAGNPKHKLEHLNDGQYGNDRSWISNSAGSGWVQLEFTEPVRIARIVWGRDRKEQYADRLPTRYRIEVADEPDGWHTVASHQAHLPPGPEAERFYRLQGLSSEEAEQAEQLHQKLLGLRAEQAALEKGTMAYAGRFVQPPATHRLYRGDPMAPRERMRPEALTVLKPVVGSLEQSWDAVEQQRRAALAAWLASPQNPLPARVIANRIWHYHFGRGIVSTPSDFGAMGAAPTHPALLDWLADELVRNNWSLKHLHRLIVLSNTYRQSSAPREKAMQVDRGATLLWRFPPRRLEAEVIRDTILQVSGALDRSMGGPGYLMFQPNANYSRNWIPKDQFGPDEFRRMVYATKLRMEQDAVFGAFDCPDAGQIAPRRPRSTTPLQALNLLNSDFMLDQAQRFAERVRSETAVASEMGAESQKGEGERSAEVTRQVERVFELAFGRRPTELERRDAAELVDQHGLPALCRAILNANEFLFLF